MNDFLLETNKAICQNKTEKKPCSWLQEAFYGRMTAITLRRGEPVDKALRRLKKILNREQTLQEVRLHRRFEKPSAKKRRKQKAARFLAMLRARDAEL